MAKRSVTSLFRVNLPRLLKGARDVLPPKERHGTLSPEALVNELYVLFVKRDRSWKNTDHFLGSALTSMRNIRRNYLRGKHAKKRRGSQPQVQLQDGDSPVLPKTTDVAVRKAWRQLPEDAKKILYLRFVLGYSPNEIQDEMSLSRSQYDYRLRVARNLFEGLMRGKGKILC